MDSSLLGFGTRVQTTKCIDVHGYAATASLLCAFWYCISGTSRFLLRGHFSIVFSFGAFSQFSADQWGCFGILSCGSLISGPVLFQRLVQFIDIYKNLHDSIDIIQSSCQGYLHAFRTISRNRNINPYYRFSHSLWNDLYPKFMNVYQFVYPHIISWSTIACPLYPCHDTCRLLLESVRVQLSSTCNILANYSQTSLNWTCPSPGKYSDRWGFGYKWDSCIRHEYNSLQNMTWRMAKSYIHTHARLPYSHTVNERPVNGLRRGNVFDIGSQRQYCEFLVSNSDKRGKLV